MLDADLGAEPVEQVRAAGLALFAVSLQPVSKGLVVVGEQLVT